jgi:hypothetical protein
MYDDEDIRIQPEPRAPHLGGPWFTSEENIGNNPDIYIEAENWGTIATIGGGPLALRRANAHLIAAAPELLAVCQKVLALMEGRDVRTPSIQNELRQAIGKALGHPSS